MKEISIAIVVEPLEEGGYLATSPEWDDILAQGRTIVETLEIVQDVARKLIESYIECGDPLPEVIRRALRQPQSPADFRIPVAVAA